MDLDRWFPRYTDFSPQVPVWCVTPDRDGCMHRFFDTSPISPTGRYLAVFEMPFEDRQPEPGEAGNVCMVDLETGKSKVVAQTCGWEPQLGANINWGGSDHELFFNDVDTSNWQPFAWKLDPLTGTRQRMEGTVYHASPDGRWLISANMTTMRRTQPGYGVCIPLDKLRRNIGLAADDGFYLTDTASGKTRLLASITGMIAEADPPVMFDDWANSEVYGFHSKFNPQGDRLMVSLRWFPALDEPRWNMFQIDHAAVKYAWITMTLDGSGKHCAVGPEQWVKRGHHATWFPDGKRISMNLNIDGEGMRLVQVNADGSDLHKMLPDTLGSGHPTVHPNGRHILTDCYKQEQTAFPDGTVPLRWIDLNSGEEKCIVRINVNQPCEDKVLRVDPHPAWDRSWRYLTARLGVAMCKGLQGDDPRYLKLVATPKHFAVHSGPEPLRHEFNAVVNERDLRETYLPHFKACVQEGKAWSVMGAYNRTLGEPCCGSKRLLQDILRGEWGFQGYVVSDCWAIKDFHLHHKVTRTPAESATLAVRNGCDLNCGDLYHSLLDAVGEGLITEAEIDVSVKRLFEARVRLGMFDPEEMVPYAAIPPSVVRCQKHLALALEVARKSIVMLKNDGVLPLSRNLNVVGVVGPNADSKIAMYANYNGFSPNVVTVADGILDRLSVGSVMYTGSGCHLCLDEPVMEGRHKVGIRPLTDAVIAVLGNTTELEGEEGGVALSDGGGDRTRIGLPGRQLELLKVLHSKGKPVVLVLLSGSAIDLSEVEPYCNAILYGWYPGEQGGNAIADVIFGDVNPSGRLPVTLVKSMDQLPPFEDYNMAGRTYRFMTEVPQYRFGFGLSYTRFAYTNLLCRAADGGCTSQVEATAGRHVASGGSIVVSVDVSNIGERAGDEVVQLYVSDMEASVPVPRHHLEGFTRVSLKTGETKTVGFVLHPDQFVCYTDDGTPFLESGAFRISVGGGQPDDPASGAVSTVLTVG